MSIHPLIHGLNARRCPVCPHFLTEWVSRLLGLALISWVFARVGVPRLSFCLPYLGVIPSTLLHLPLGFIRVSSLRPTYLNPFGQPFTYSLFKLGAVHKVRHAILDHFEPPPPCHTLSHISGPPLKYVTLWNPPKIRKSWRLPGSSLRLWTL